jgi:hypothetical protein
MHLSVFLNQLRGPFTVMMQFLASISGISFSLMDDTDGVAILEISPKMWLEINMVTLYLLQGQQHSLIFYITCRIQSICGLFRIKCPGSWIIAFASPNRCALPERDFCLSIL